MEGEECPVEGQQEVMEMEDPVEAQQEVMEMEEFTNLVVNSLAETNEIVNQKIEPEKEIEKEEQLQENYENENADEDLVSIQKEERAIKIKNEDGAEDEEESSGADSNGAEIFRCLGAEFGANNIQNLKWGVTKENRCCTDIPFLVAIVLFCLILGLTIVKPAVDAGHHKRIVASQDYLKNYCGYDAMINKEFGAWPNTSKFDFMHCIASCDETLTSFGYPSTNVYNLCVPDDREIDFANYWKELSPQLMVADLLNYKDWYLKASACTFVVLLGWFLIIKYLLRYVIYLLPVIVAGGPAFGSYLLYQPYAANPDDEKVSLYLCILCGTVGTLLFCCSTCCMGHFMKVMDVIEMSISVLFNFEMFFVPIISLVLSGTVLVLFLMLFALLYSSTGAYAKYPIGNNEPYANDDADFYHVFEIDFVIYEETVLIVLWFFWIMKFVDYVNFLIISGSVGEWYLMKSLRAEREEANTSFVESGCCGRLCGSVFRTIFYHLVSF